LARRYPERDVLDYLANYVVYNPGCFFAAYPEHGYFYAANSRPSLFADDANWAIVLEKSGYAHRAFEIEPELTFFGGDPSKLISGGR
jgi:uncharacterized protein DUF7003